MRAAQITNYLPNKEISVIDDVHEPTITSGYVKIKVLAAALNPIDWKMTTGELKQFMQLPFPFIPGSDFAGRVEKIGKGVKHIQVGDEVYGMAGFNRKGSGSLAELTVADAAFVWQKPTTLSFEQAAAVPMTGLRAWHVLYECLQLTAGQKILIHGGAGGIGTFAIQIAKHIGAQVTTTVSARDIEYVKHLGADTAIDYKKEDFSQVPPEYDAVFDVMGGETFAKSFAVLKPGGKITTMLWERRPDLVEKYKVVFIEQGESTTEKSFTELGKLIDQGIVQVQIARIFPFHEVGEAFEYQQHGHPRGKVVIKIQ